MDGRFINPSAARPELFLSNVPLWDLNINGYQVVMIIWNCLLAVIAIALALKLAKAIAEKTLRPWLVGALGLAWLLLAPNTAYIMTDSRHIIGYCPAEEYGHVCADNAWMTVFFFAYALLGWISFVFAVRPVHEAIVARSKKIGSWFIAVMMPLFALGVLIGLVNRWNSWEAVTDFPSVIRTIWTYVHDLTYLWNWLIMTILLTLLYFCGYRLLKSQQGYRS